LLPEAEENAEEMAVDALHEDVSESAAVTRLQVFPAESAVTFYAAGAGRLLYFDKKRSSEIAGGQAIIGPDAIRTSNFYEDNIEHFWANVK